MSEASAEFSLLVDFVDTFVLEVVDTVEVFCITRDSEGIGRFLDRNNCFKDCSFAVLNPLSHRVEVSCEIDSGGENTFTIFSFRLAVKLFPPFGEEMQSGVEVDEQFDFFAVSIESVSHHGVDLSRVVHSGTFCGVFHIFCATDQFFDIESGASDREKTYRGQDGESATDVVRDYVRFVSFLVGHCSESPFALVGDGDDKFFSFFEADLLYEEVFEDTESDSRFGGST